MLKHTYTTKKIHEPIPFPVWENPHTQSRHFMYQMLAILCTQLKIPQYCSQFCEPGCFHKSL